MQFNLKKIFTIANFQVVDWTNGYDIFFIKDLIVVIDPNNLDDSDTLNLTRSSISYYVIRKIKYLYIFLPKFWSKFDRHSFSIRCSIDSNFSTTGSSWFDCFRIVVRLKKTCLGLQMLKNWIECTAMIFSSLKIQLSWLTLNKLDDLNALNLTILNISYHIIGEIF